MLCCPLIAIGTTELERDAAVRRTREQVGMFLSSPTYRPVLELHGLGRLGDELTAVTLTPDNGRWHRAGDLIDDTTLNLFTVTTPPHDLDTAIHQRFDGLADHVCLPLAPPASAEDLSAI